MRTPGLRPAPALRALAALALLLGSGGAEANPKGGQVVAGSATIAAPSANRLDINQSTDRAAINWMSFNIAPQEQTNFHQPSASSMTLNRVQAGDPSVIAGRLTANGQIVLVNPSGIVFSKGSQVDFNSLIATPADISNRNFMAGRMVFDRPSADPRARVVNHGTITVAQKGFAALVAPGAANSGVIQAKLGKVVLAGAETFTVDFYGDGLINFDVGSKVTSAPRGADGKPAKSLVANSGLIDAPGGTVLLTADAAAGIVENVVDVPGRIYAGAGARGSAGAVTIDAGLGNAARLAGKIDVSGLRPGQTGGAATVTGGAVALASSARIDARGKAGGGRVAIGGGPHGKDPKVRNARTTTVAAGARIDAGATGNGKGGEVAVWSDDATLFDGAIRARGGPLGGDGGWVETSGEHLLTVGAPASLDASSPKGKAGRWLLDPDSDVHITKPPPPPPNPVTCVAGVCRPKPVAAGDTSTLDPTVIDTALTGGTSVTVITFNPKGTQRGNIFVGETAGGADGKITLAAGAKANVSLTLDAGAGYTALTGGAGGTGTGGVTVNSPITDAGAGKKLSLVLNAGGAISFKNSVNLTGSLKATGGINTAGAISQTAAGVLDVDGGSSFTNQASDSKIALTAATNVLDGGVKLTTAGTTGNASLKNSGGTTLAASTVNGKLSVEDTTGSIAQSGKLTVSGTSSFKTDTANRTIALATATNPLKEAVTLRTAGTTGDASLKNSGGTTLAASTVNGNLSVEDTTGSIAQSGKLTVSGTSSFKTDTANRTITLATATNALKEAVTLRSAGTTGDVNLKNSGGTTLAASTVNGKLSVEDTTGNIAQSGKLTVSGTSSFKTDTANRTITLTTATNALTGAVTLDTAGAGAASLTDGKALKMAGKVGGAATLVAPSIEFETFSAGSLAATATTDGISQTGAVTVAGTSSFTDKKAGKTIALTNPGNALTGQVALSTSGAAGAASLTDGKPLSVTGKVGGAATLTAPSIRFDTFSAGSLTATATTGGISQTGAVTVTGISSFTDLTADQTIVLTNLGNQLRGAVSLNTLGAGAASLVNGVATTLSTSTVGGELQVATIASPLTVAAAATVNAKSVDLGVGSDKKFTNKGKVQSIGTGPQDAVVVLADTMSLSGGTISALSSVVLGPSARSRPISLGKTVAGDLSLLNADLKTITAPMLQIGYRTTSGAQFSGNISVAGAITIDPAKVPNLALVTGGAGTIAQSGTGVISAGELGLAGGSDVSMTLANKVNSLAGFSDGGHFTFVNGQKLTIDALAAKTLGVAVAGGTGLVSSVALPGTPARPNPLSGVVVNGKNIILRTTTGDLVLDRPVNANGGTATLGANPGQIGLETLNGGIIQTAAGVIVGSAVEALATRGSVQLAAAANRIGKSDGPPATVAGLVAGKAETAGKGFALRDDDASMRVDTVQVSTVAGALGLALAAQDGVTTAGGAGGNIVLQTTTAGGLILDQPVNATATGSVALASAGTISQSNAAPKNGVITARDLEIASADQVSLGAFGGTDVPNVVTGTLAAKVTNPGESFVLRDELTAAQTLTIGSLDVAGFGPIAGVTTNNANLGLRVTGAGNLAINADVSAGTGVNAVVGLDVAGAVSEAAATAIRASALAIDPSGPVALLGPNHVGTLAASVTGAASSFAFRDDNTSLTVGTVAALVEQSKFVAPPPASGRNGDRMLSFGALSGVTTNLGNVVLETTTSGNLLLAQPVNANNGTTVLAATPGQVGLSSAGTIAQSGAGLIVAAGVETVSVGSTSLELANLVGNAAGAGTPGVLAGRVLTAGDSFGFRDDGQSLSVDTVDVKADGVRLTLPSGKPLKAALRGVATQGATGGNILIETTAAGDLALNQRVDAAANFDPASTTLALTGPVLGAAPGEIGLSSAGTLTQSGAGLVVAAQLETVSVGSTSLELANLLGNAAGAGTAGVLAGRVLTPGESFGFRDDANSLTVGTVDVTKAGGVRLTLPSGKLLTAALSGVATRNGNILIETTTAGDLVLAQRADAAANFDPTSTALALTGPTLGPTPGLVGLSSAGSLTQSATGLVVAAGLETVSVNTTKLEAANLVGNAAGAGTPGLLAGRVLTPGAAFGFRDEANSLTVSTVDVTKAGGVRLTLPSGKLLTAALSGVATQAAAGGDIVIETTGSGNLRLDQRVDAAANFNPATDTLALTGPVLGAAPGRIGLSSAGTIAQDATNGLLVGAQLEVVAAERVSLGAFVGPAEQGAANLIGTATAPGVVAARVAGAGESFVLRDAAATGLTVGSVTLAPLGAVTGVTTDNADIGLRATAGPLGLAANVSAGTGEVGLEAAGSLVQAAGTVKGASLEIAAAGPVSLPDANAVPRLAALVTGAGNSLFFRDGATSLTIDAVGPVVEQGTGTPPVNQMLSVGALSGVVTNNGAIVLETTTAGNLTLAQTVNANGGTTALGAAPGLIGLSSAGGITQAPAGLVVGAGLALSAKGDVVLGEANRLGANDTPADATGVPTGSGTIAGDLLASVFFRADRAATSADNGLVVGTVAVADSFGRRMLDQRTGAAVPAGGLSGVVTANADIVIETTTAGNLVLAQTVNANGGKSVLGAAPGRIGLSSAGTITQDAANGRLVGAQLEVVAAQRVSLGAFVGPAEQGAANLIGTATAPGVVAARVQGAGESFVLRDAAATGMTVGSVTLAPLGTVTGVTTNNADLGLRATAALLRLAANVSAGTGEVGLEAAGSLVQAAGAVRSASLEITAAGPVSLPDANAVGQLAGRVAGTNRSFLFRDEGTTLTIDTVGPVVEQGAGTPPANQMLSVGALSGVVTNNGAIILETTATGNLALNQPVDAGAGSIGLSSAGTITQSITAPNNGIITTTATGADHGLEIVAAERVSLGAFVGPADEGAANRVAQLGGEVLGTGESFVLRSVAPGLTVTTVEVKDAFGRALLNPLTAAPLAGPLSGVVTRDADLGLRATAGRLRLAANVSAGTGEVGLEAAGAVTEKSARVTGAALEIAAAGPVSLLEANVVPRLAARLTGADKNFLFRDEATTLTIDTVGSILEQGTGAPPANQMLSVGALSGVVTNNGAIVLETTTSGDLVLAQTINANNGTLVLGAAPGRIGLGSAGTITQDRTNGVLVGAQLEVVAAERVSLGAFVGPAEQGAANLIGTATAPGVVAARVAGAGQSFVLRDAAATGLTVGSVTLAPLGAVTGVTTNNADIGLRATAGPLGLAANVSAGTGEVGLEAAGSLVQAAGTVKGASLEIAAAGPVSLPDANAVPRLAALVTGAGNSLFFRDGATSLTIDAVGPVVEQGTGTPPASQMLSVGALSGVVTNNGAIVLETTAAGNLTLAQTVNANGGSTVLGAAPGPIGLSSAGGVSQSNAGLIVGSALEVLAANDVVLSAANRIGAADGPPAAVAGLVAAKVTGAGSSFALRDDAASLTVSTLTVAATGLTLPTQSGVTTSNGAVTLRTTTAGNLSLSRPVDAGTGVATMISAGAITETAGGTVTADVLTGSAAAAADFGRPGNAVANLGAFATGDDFTLADGRSLTITGPVSMPGNTVTLTVAGSIAEAAGGSITAATLTGRADGDALFDLAGNRVENLGLFAAGGDFALTDGRALDIAGPVNAGGTVTLNVAGAIVERAGGTITAATLTGSAAGGASFDQTNRLETVGQFRTGGIFALTDGQSLIVAGPVSSGGDLRIRAAGGDLTVTGAIAAPNAALISTTGNAAETVDGHVTAGGLILHAAGDVRFGIIGGTPVAANDVGTVTGSAGGTFGFLNGPGLTVGAVPTIVDVPAQSEIRAGGDALIQTNNPGQALTLAGNITAGGRVVLDSAGPFTQTGAVTVDAPVLVIDTTGDGIDQVLAKVPASGATSDLIAQFPPQGNTANPIQLENLNAPNAVTLLVANLGPIAGQLNVGQLGVSGTQPGNAGLTGTVTGIGGPGAASISVPSPRPQNQFLLNNCVIGSPNCILLPPVVPVQPQPVNELDVLTLAPQAEDPDAPIINIYDEERLCDPRPEAPPAAREACQ